MNLIEVASRIAAANGVTWTLLLNDWESGSIEIYLEGPVHAVSGDTASERDEAVIQYLLANAGPRDKVIFKRGYAPYGQFETTMNDLEQTLEDYRLGLWHFE